MNAGLHLADLFRGAHVRLAINDAETLGKAWSQWNRDTVFYRLVDSNPPLLYSSKAIKEFIEKDEIDNTAFLFNIHTCEDDRLIGFIELVLVNWNNGEAWVAMGIGSREDWDHGYGSEALQLLLRFAFDELNLHRVSLGVFSHNARAIRAYEKTGFRIEGRERGTVIRDGTRTDDITMGILHSEWAAHSGAAMEALK